MLKNIFLRMRRSLSAVFALLIALTSFSVLTGCTSYKQNGDGVSVVCTTFPGYDIARAVCGNLAEITLLIPPGSDSHSYEPSPSELIAISESDLFVCVGGASDGRIEQIADALSSDGDAINMLRLVECVPLIEEDHDEHGDHGEHDGHDAHEAEYDEHVWTSPRRAAQIAECIRDELCRIDGSHSDEYTANCAGYTAELHALDGAFEKLFAEADDPLLIFADRFPFAYFTADYGIEYCAAFPGCAEQTEPNIETVAFLIEKAKEHKVSTVFYTELSGEKFAQIVASECGASAARLNPCHNVTRAELDAGVTYLSVMRENLDVLRTALLANAD